MHLIYEIGIFLGLGLATGLISGLFGIGGGFIRIPIFIAVLPLIGIPSHLLMHFAIGTSVALIIPTAIASSVKQYSQGNLDLRFYRGWALGVMIGVLLGLALVPYASTREFQILFLLLVVIVILYLGFVPDAITLSKQAPQGMGKAFVAIVIGMISALTGTGGGALTTPVLKMFSVPLKKAIAVASATGLVIGVISTVGFVLHGWSLPNAPRYSFGYVNLFVFFSMTPTVFLGASAGARLNNCLSDRMIKCSYIVLLVVVAANVTYRLVS